MNPLRLAMMLLCLATYSAVAQTPKLPEGYELVKHTFVCTVKQLVYPVNARLLNLKPDQLRKALTGTDDHRNVVLYGKRFDAANPYPLGPITIDLTEPGNMFIRWGKAKRTPQQLKLLESTNNPVRKTFVGTSHQLSFDVVRIQRTESEPNWRLEWHDDAAYRIGWCDERASR